MDSIILKSGQNCTGCGACVFACPKKCISLKKDLLGNVYPKINHSICIKCNKCNKICPSVNKVNSHIPKTCYVAWSKNKKIRLNSASGGIASSIYEYCLNNGIKTFGVRYLNNIAEFIEINSKKNIEECKNSKYMYSYLLNSLDLIKKYVSSGEKVVIPGLPCQIAAILNICGNRANLITIDIVCHGTCSEDYLKNHLCHIKSKNKIDFDKVCFREPTFGTQNFVFSLKNKDSLVYSAKVDSFDSYQNGYHNSLIYRNNCYKCAYAKRERIGDFTISDFSGLGNIDSFNYSKKSVSCILINTEKGRIFLDSLLKNQIIEMYRRPIEEAYNYEKQLNHPSIPHRNVKVFQKNYIKTNDFEYSVNNAMFCDYIMNLLYIRRIKKIIILGLSKVLSRNIKDKLKKLLK